ncbi:MAG: single-stranded-DNA-specific exonuclease [Thermoleophilaceae bacterium]|nr:single-stranded-DNA-specific exonuclease [Thermoleophilaceae bacterium]
MLSKPARWSCEPYDVAVAERLAAGLGVSRPVGAILARRGFATVDDARRFLDAEERHDPLTLPGVTAACELIVAHLRRGSRIAVFGDYDVDGVCSTTILVRTLRALGADPVWELPSRFDEGYGLSTAAVERLAGRGVGLLVTVDCGITAVEQVAAARAAGLDVVVSDHHRPGERLPDCVVVHPALPVEPGGPAYACPELCAAGVVLKLCEALHGAAGGDPHAVEEHLDLAALATVCDLVPLRGENRRIVREGLAAIARTRKPGLRALMSVAAVEPAELTEHSLGFRLGPRINAAGRMRRADAALELLLTEDAARAAEVARELDLLNGDRRQAETRILFAAEAACAPQASQAAIVVAGEDWHPGVVGIVASRLVERWRRPCVVIALDEDGSGRGSGRSISPYDLHDGLAACAGHLTRFGGHRMAAGVELAADEVEPFRRALAAHAGAALAPEDLIPVERVDAIVPGGLLGLELAEELESLRPFGMGNPQPTLLVPAARFQNVTGMGEDKEHARFTLVTAGGARSRGVAFGSPPKALAPAADENHDIALRLERNRWKGVVEPRTILRALCPTRAGELRVLGEEGTFWERLRQALGSDLPPPAGTGAAPLAPIATAPEPIDRRREGFAGVAGDLFTSGERVLVAVADVERRRHGLEQIVAGLAQGGMAVASWTAIAADPRLAVAHDHLVALDPPPGGRADPLLRQGPRAHMAWGPAEAEFALHVWRAEHDLRPALASTFRALRELPAEPDPEILRCALQAQGRYPRAPAACARLIVVLGELALIEFTADPPACRVLEADRTDLERSAAYRACAERLAAIERALAAELPAAAAASRAA